MGERVVIMAGGTGGHIFPALAVADVLREQGHQVSWMGTQKGMEATLVPAAGFEVDWLSVSGLRGKGALSLLFAPYMLIKACVQAAKVLRQRKPNVVLGMGGFVAGPGGLMAWVLGIPLLIHEQNRIPGTTNSLLRRIATRVLEAFPDSFSADAEALTTGNPLREAIVKTGGTAASAGSDVDKLHILVLGGSQGARILNETVPEAAKLISTPNIEILHQCGKSMLDIARRAYESVPHKVIVTAFLDDMAAAYAWADIVICRSGAMTVSELAAMGKPAILVPFPQAIDDHQTWNARYLADGGAARLIPQNELTAGSLATLVDDLVASPGMLAGMGKAAHTLAKTDASRVVAELCIAEAKS